MSYVFVDFETTGFISEQSDRAVELAGVLTDEQFVVQDVFETLFNPERDVGPTRVHGIRASDVLGAPKFADVAGGLTSFLHGHTLVAHNIVFDRRFLVAELDRCSEAHTLGDPVCTMSTAREAGLPAKLDELASVLEIRRKGVAHSALSDAYVSLGVARKLGLGKGSKFESGTPFVTRNTLPVLLRKTATEIVERRELFLTLPDGLTVAEAAYLDMLSDFLSDSILDDVEMDALDNELFRMNVTDEQVHDLHYQYIHHVIERSAGDGVIDNDEARIIQAAAEALHVDANVVSTMAAIALVEAAVVPGKLSEGMTVCLTGEYVTPRKQLTVRAEEVGLIVKPNVTKKMGALVCNGTGSMSGKAKKARSYGIPILHYKDLEEFINANQ